jgi:hypothetical protein
MTMLICKTREEVLAAARCAREFHEALFARVHSGDVDLRDPSTVVAFTRDEVMTLAFSLITLWTIAEQYAAMMERGPSLDEIRSLYCAAEEAVRNAQLARDEVKAIADRLEALMPVIP